MTGGNMIDYSVKSTSQRDLSIESMKPGAKSIKI